MNIDHVVLWVDDPKVSRDFYVDLLGFVAVRSLEYEEGNVGFPSVRVNEATILDLMNKTSASAVEKFTGGGGESAGHPINHICLSMDATEYSALAARLNAQGIELTSGGEQAFGAQGLAEVRIHLRPEKCAEDRRPRRFSAGCRRIRNHRRRQMDSGAAEGSRGELRSPIAFASRRHCGTGRPAAVCPGER